MADPSDNKIERIENEGLVKLLGKIRSDNSEENMIALLKEAAVSKFIVPVDGSEGGYSFHAVSDKNGLKYMVVYSDSDSFEVAFEGKYKKQQGVAAGFGDLIEVVMSDKMGLSGFVINPGVEEVLFGKDMIKLIAQQMGIGGDGTAKVGEPDKWYNRDPDDPYSHVVLTHNLSAELDAPTEKGSYKLAFYLRNTMGQYANLSNKVEHINGYNILYKI